MKTIGEKSEAIVLAELIKRDIPVSLPFGDNQRYDMLIDINNKILKIQIKTINFKEEYMTFEACSSSTHRGGKKKSYKGEIDYFIAYCSELNKVYMMHIDEASKTTVTMRINTPKNNQTANIKWAVDYEIDKQLNKLLS